MSGSSPISGAENFLAGTFTVSRQLARFRRPTAREVPVVSMSTESYGALIERLRDLDGSVFTAREAQSLRDAADARLFGDPDQIETVTRVLEMLETLVEAARLSTRTSRQLGDLLCSIEPAAGVES
jgi:hypothetical protein